MAKSKPEKISISVSSAASRDRTVADVKSPPEIITRASKHIRINPETFDGGFAERMHKPGDTVHPKQLDGEDDSPNTDTGHAVPRQRPATKNVQPNAVAVDLSQDAESKARYDAGAALKTEDEVEDFPELKSDDFYSSKFNHELTNHRPGPISQGTGKKLAANNLRLWFIFGIFLITLAAGLVMLYQLEQAQSGAGLIFEWLEDLNLPSL